MRVRVPWLASIVLALAVAGATACRNVSAPASDSPAASSYKALDVPYEPTPPEVVWAMLQLAAVGPDDVVYDLGCGDGRIVIEAAKLGARGVGVDLDPDRISEARANARATGVEERVTFVEADLFGVDVSPATVVMLYLWPDVNLRLRPRLLAQLRPGARVVSHLHDMGDWRPARTVQPAGRRVHLWIVPERAR
jgi:SAM-dependent methyltransferase